MGSFSKIAGRTPHPGEIKSPESRRLFHLFGGAERDRTADLLVANEALSQLSYSPPPDAHRTPLSQPQHRRTTSSSVPASATRLKPRTACVTPPTHPLAPSQ